MQTIEPTIVALFDDRYEAEVALRDLEASGFEADQVGLVIRGSAAVEGGTITDAQATKDGRGAVAGAIGGAMAGGLLGAVGTVLIPGVGPILAAGLFAAILGGAAAGTAVGGILGAMAGLGISEEEAAYYEGKFHEGKAIVAVKPGDREVQAEDILRSHGGYDIRRCGNCSVPTEGIMSKP